jgi:hypothetical protein
MIQDGIPKSSSVLFINHEGFVLHVLEKKKKFVANELIICTHDHNSVAVTCLSQFCRRIMKRYENNYETVSDIVDRD